VNSRWIKPVLRGVAVFLLLNLGTYYTIVWFKSLAAPSVRTFALWSSIVVLFLLLVPSRSFRLICAYLLAGLLALTGFEAYASSGSHEEHAAPPTNSLGYYSSERADVLGFGPALDFVNHSVLDRDGRTIYDVKYTIDRSGLRVAPPEAADPVGTVLFFGDSFTFGEGVADSETLPYRLGTITAGRYRVRNFAFQGYGPHQMLSELEHGLVRRLVESRGKVTAIYQAIPDHVRRSAGLAFYDTHGPRYVLGGDHRAHFSGHFDDGGFSIFLRKLFVYQRLNNVRTEVGESEIELFAAVVSQSSEILAREYGADFHVLYWDMPKDPHTAAIASALSRRGLDVRPMSKILPGYPARESEYTIAGDGHPNPKANALIAEYVARSILSSSADATTVSDRCASSP
jgi:hypothetical protein